MNFPTRREMVPIKLLKNHPRNYRRGNVDAILNSIESHGQILPLLVQSGTNIVLSGNHTLKALKAAGYKETMVEYIECDDEEGLRILLQMNQTSDVAINDIYQLTDLLTEISESSKGLDGTGYDGDSLNALLDSMGAKPPVEPEEEALNEIDAGTVTYSRISSRNGVFWHSIRAFRSKRRKAMLKGLKAAKDSADPTWVETIAQHISDYIQNNLAALDSNVLISTPPARDSAFKGNPHFATEIAKQVAIENQLQWIQMFEPGAADRRGHHPAREKEPPKIVANRIKGNKILLIDDTATSGATIESCVNALKERGFKVTALVWVYDEITNDTL